MGKYLTETGFKSIREEPKDYKMSNDFIAKLLRIRVSELAPKMIAQKLVDEEDVTQWNEMLNALEVEPVDRDCRLGEIHFLSAVK